jgi:hypothetical protein
MPTSEPDLDADRFVLVFTAATASEGLLAKGLLEAEGIRVVVKGEAEGPYRVGSMDLWVPVGSESTARSILEAARSGALTLDDGSGLTENGSGEAP